MQYGIGKWQNPLTKKYEKSLTYMIYELVFGVLRNMDYGRSRAPMSVTHVNSLHGIYCTSRDNVVQFEMSEC